MPMKTNFAANRDDNKNGTGNTNTWFRTADRSLLLSFHILGPPPPLFTEYELTVSVE